ncbi:hypothetical protein TRAPUB_11861 [Trametes pubescens]|uniref:DUF6593 domain-containing protein n=1 Tax=Trametes pubescens TaxID=154538 RepID=A0A1M2VVK8_TRAPU|nr:hypothetical protein TRAPUB_11861 [Trametes pubescens]
MNPLSAVRRKSRLITLSRSAAPAPSTDVGSASPKSDTSKALPPQPKPVLQLNFYQRGFNAMIAYADATVHYHISICMNCFVPSSFVTIIKRSHEKGEFVSSFEMGISTQRATVNMRGDEKFVDSVLTKTGPGRKANDRLWKWRWDSTLGHDIGWKGEKPVRNCYRLDSAGTPAGPILATFVLGASAAQHASGSPQPASLVIYPDGRQVVEHILTSVLVLERKRLTPTPTSVTPLFN